jgi:hypothetical protein
MTMVGKPEETRIFGRPRRRWEDNIKIDLRVIGWECVDWIHLAQDTEHCWVLVNTVINLWVP